MRLLWPIKKQALFWQPLASSQEGDAHPPRRLHRLLLRPLLAKGLEMNLSYPAPSSVWEANHSLKPTLILGEMPGTHGQTQTRVVSLWRSSPCGRGPLDITKIFPRWLGKGSSYEVVMDLSMLSLLRPLCFQWKIYHQQKARMQHPKEKAFLKLLRNSPRWSPRGKHLWCF